MRLNANYTLIALGLAAGITLAGCGSAATTTTIAPTNSASSPAVSQSSTLTAATVLQRDGYAGDYQPGGNSQAWVNNTFANAAQYVSSAEGGYYTGQQDGENGEIVAIMSQKGVDVYGESTLQTDLARSFNPTTITADPSGVYIIRMSTGQ